MARALKVFRADMGFYEAVVAVPSKAAALEAWGAHQDLFATGGAGLTDDPKAVKAATARPGVVLRRPAGSDEAFREDPRAITAEDLPPPKPKPAAKRRTPDAPPPPPDRSALTAAERALAEVEEEGQARLGEIEARRRALDAEAFTAEREIKARRAAAQKAVDRARKAYEKAGG